MEDSENNQIRLFVDLLQETFFLLKYLIKMFYLRLKWETQSLSSLRVKANVFVIHVNVHVR